MPVLRKRIAPALGAALGAVFLASPAAAQDPGGYPEPRQLGLSQGFSSGQAELGLPQSLVLVLKSDRFFAESAYGRQVAEDIQARSAVLTAENRRIEAELRAEEKSLSQRRQFTDADAFRTLADAFDEKVQATRVTQENKYREITQADEEARLEFQRISGPVLEQIMRDVGAAVVLEKGSVLLSADTIDITDLAIARIDAILGNIGERGPVLPGGDGSSEQVDGVQR